MLRGILIKESLEDDEILGGVSVDALELWPANDDPHFWTAIHFSTEDVTFPSRLAKVMRKDWFCDMKYGERVKVLVFYRKVMQYTIGNMQEKANVLKYCKKIGIPTELTNWQE